MIESSDCIILNSRKYGDSGKIISAFTSGAGRFSLIAKGARKAKNKFGSALEPLSFSNIQYYFKPNRGLQLLSKAETVRPLRRIFESFDHLSAGLMILESVSITQDENAASEEVFEQLVKAVFLLDELVDHPFSVFIRFQLFLAGQLGFEPDFNNAEPLMRSNGKGSYLLFSLEQGTFVSGSGVRSNAFRLDNGAIHALEEFSRTGIERSGFIRLEGRVQKMLMDFFVRYFSFHLEKSVFFRTMDIINSGMQ